MTTTASIRLWFPTFRIGPNFLWRYISPQILQKLKNSQNQYVFQIRYKKSICSDIWIWYSFLAPLWRISAWLVSLKGLTKECQNSTLWGNKIVPIPKPSAYHSAVKKKLSTWKNWANFHIFMLFSLCLIVDFLADHSL